MAQITTLTRSGDVGRSQIKVYYSCSLEYDNPTYPPPGNNYTQETISNFSIKVNDDEQFSANQSGYLSCNYTVNKVIEKLTLTATLKYKYKTGESKWVNNGANSYPSYDGERETDWYIYNKQPFLRTRTVIVDTYPDTEGNTVYKYEDQYQKVEIEWSSEEEKTAPTKTLDFYPAPPNFTFVYNLINKEKKWDVGKSIATLITNINDFSNYATQWKKWKNQSSQSSCPSFSSGGKITASAMNSVHSYVGTGNSYSQGQKISEGMFDSLENAINA